VVDSTSNRNEYKEYFMEGKGSRCVRLTPLQPPCADWLGIWEPQPPGTLRGCPGVYRDCFAFYCGIIIVLCVFTPHGRLFARKTTDKGNPNDRAVACACRRSLAEPAGSNPAGDMDVRLL
jgi:hypothetical protein